MMIQNNSIFDLDLIIFKAKLSADKYYLVFLNFLNSKSLILHEY